MTLPRNPSDFNLEELGKEQLKNIGSAALLLLLLGRGDGVVSQPYTPVLAHLYLPPIDPLQHLPGNLLKDSLNIFAALGRALKEEQSLFLCVGRPLLRGYFPSSQLYYL